MTPEESFKYDVCDLHEWAGYGFCPKCEAEMEDTKKALDVLDDLSREGEA